MRSSVLLGTLLLMLTPAILCADEWHSLFDGKTLNGWKAATENPDSWQVVDGALVSQGARCHLFYVGEVAGHDFKNFELSAQVMTTPGSNSGIYVHTKYQEEGWPEVGYELQVINSNPASDGYVENKMTGSIYAIRNTWIAPVGDHEWFNYRILVSGKTIQTFVDDKLICSYTESEDCWRSADKLQRKLSSGTFALQAHDPDSVVHFRDLKVRLLPDDAPSLGASMMDAELDQLITDLSNRNFAIIDVGLTPTDLLLESARFFGLTIPDDSDLAKVRNATSSVIVFNDRERAPAIDLLRAAKAASAKVAFSSGGAKAINPERLKRRLRAIKEAEIDWTDIWIPGKN